MVKIGAEAEMVGISEERSTALLRLQDVKKQYVSDGQPVKALDGVTLDVADGEFVALVGRSGCGKSTLLNLSGAMDFPSSGKVLLEGIDTSTLDDAGLTQLRREKVGFIFQSFQLLHTLSVVENVELPLLLAGVSGARVRAVERLKWVELEELAGRLPHQLSGGQMQRVAIARSLVHGPRLLVCDEPTAALDHETGLTVMELLRQVAVRPDRAVVVVTHDNRVFSFGERIAHMDDGRIVHVDERGVVAA